MKFNKSIYLTLVIASMSTSSFAESCSGLVGKYSLVQSISDTAPYDDCPENLFLKKEKDGLVLGREDGAIFYAFQANFTSTTNTSRGPFIEKVKTKESYSKCSAEVKNTRSGLMFLVPFISNEYVNLDLDKSRTLFLKSKNFRPLSGNGKIECIYKKL